MSRTSAYKIRVRTGTDDSNALLLLDAGELVAILVELDDESHGELRGRWNVEVVFGHGSGGRPGTFACAADAADWVGEHMTIQPFLLGGDLVELH